MLCSFLKDAGLTLSMPAIVAGGNKYPDATLQFVEPGKVCYITQKHTRKELAILVTSLVTCTEG